MWCHKLLFLFPVLPFLSKVLTPLGRLMSAWDMKSIFFAGRALNRSESLPKDALVGEGWHGYHGWQMGLSRSNFTLDEIRKHCQRHNGPEGWVHIKALTQIFMIRISTNHQLQNLDQKLRMKHPALSSQLSRFRFEWNCFCKELLIYYVIVKVGSSHAPQVPFRKSVVSFWQR